jgi:UDP-GlcNAc:undecaprenyl-phosphate GlcNAc-1-phosphate transferase
MSAIVIYIICILFFSFLVTYLLIPFFCRLAHKTNLLDQPDGKIKIQEKPVPYLGGVAVYAGFMSSLLIFALANFSFIFNFQFILFLFAVTLLMILGLVDDLIVLSPHEKFFGQLIAALCFLEAGFYLKEEFFYTWWHIPFSLLWILSLINAFNLVDVMDGLTATIGMGALCSFGAIAIYFHCYSPLLLLATLFGPLAAFFVYNKPPASIYLGDAGSLFIGGFFAAVPFLFPWGTYTWDGYLTPVVLLAIPLLELGTLILIRTYKGIPFYKGSPDHFSLYLQRNGWSKNTILLYIVILNAIQLIISLIFVAHGINTITLFVIAGMYAIVWYTILCPPRNSIWNLPF